MKASRSGALAAWWWLSGVVLALLSACGGEHEVSASEFATRMHTAQAPRSAAGPTTADPATLFDWAQWKYPSVFYGGSQNATVIHEGIVYTVRTYGSGNHLGVTPAGYVYGLGPFTQGNLQRLGHIADFESQIQADNCAWRQVGCAAPRIVNQPLHVQSAAGRSASFSVAVAAGATAQYQWEVSADQGRSYTDVPGATSSAYTTEQLTGSADGRRYRVRVSAFGLTTTSEAAELTLRTGSMGDFLPLGPGSVWVYEDTAYARPDVVKVVGNTEVNGQPGAIIETRYGEDDTVVRDVYVQSPEGVRLAASDDSDPLNAALAGTLLLKLPAEVGTSYEQLDVTVNSPVDLDGDGRPDQVRITATQTVVGLGSVNTAAGRFDEALHVRQTVLHTYLPSSGLRSVDVRTDVDHWFAEHIGPIRSDRRVSGPGIDERGTLQLSSYRVGSRTSEHVPLHVRQVLPAPGSAQVRSGAIAATLSQPIDPSSVIDDSLVVTDASGNRVPGSVRLSGRALEFTPARLLPSNTYHATVSAGLRDALGRSLGQGHDWHFTIDALGPTASPVFPLPGAEDVPLDARILIGFSETPRIDSINSYTVQLYHYNTEVPAVRSLSGNQLELRPLAPLEPGQPYRLSVYGTKDLLGNSGNVLLEFRFQTSQGRHAAPRKLFGQETSITSTTIADVNGDGLPDVLGVVGALGPPELRILYGKADGTLAPPTVQDLSKSVRCGFNTVQTGDLNQDGRTDVLLSAGGCGVLVLYQSPSGALVPADLLTDATSGLVRIVDLDRTGQPVLIGASHSLGDGTVQIWRRGSNGAWSMTEQIGLGRIEGLSDLAVGDLNHDGKNDIVLSIDWREHRQLAILYAKSGGGFHAAKPLGLGSNSTLSTIVIADLNDDGRDDLACPDPRAMATAVFYQAADGEMGPPTSLPNSDMPQFLVAGDVDKDGRTDLIGMSATGSFLVHRQRQDGSLSPVERYRTFASSRVKEAIAIGDVNRDGLIDLVAGNSLVLQLPPEAWPPTMSSNQVERGNPARESQRPMGASAAMVRTVPILPSRLRRSR